jgi:predicted HTH domain antitoxin
LKSNQIKIKYPDSLPDLLQETPEEFEKEARLAMAVKLFEWKRLSSGMAAQIAGMDRVSFLMSLHLHGVAMIDLPDADLKSDLKNA